MRLWGFPMTVVRHLWVIRPLPTDDVEWRIMEEKMVKVPYRPMSNPIYWSADKRDGSYIEPIYRTIEVPESVYNKWVERGEDVHWNAYAMAFRRDCGIGEFDETVRIYEGEKDEH